MILFPNAKINIGLHILRRRADGYHDIETVMVPIPWCDILEMVPSSSKEHKLSVTGRAVDCPPEKNLVLKAVRAMSQARDIPPTEFYLHKIIPDGAGLGGGSSDAAFTVKGLNDMYNLGLSQNEMAEILAKVGADCPFFIYNRPMLATDTGIMLEPLSIDLADLYILVAKPRSGSVATGTAYAACKPDASRRPLSEALRSTDMLQWQTVATNDFEPVISGLIPRVAELKLQLADMGALYASMSGSGSAVFGLFAHDIMSEVGNASFEDCDIFCGKL